MKDISPELIQKYLNGNCTSDEEVGVLDWYNSFENEPNPYFKLSDDQQKELQKRMLNNIESHIQKHTSRINNIITLKKLAYWVSASAAVFLIVFGLLFINRHKKGSEPQSEQIVVINKTKSIYKQVLPDKSIVWLSPDAEIRFKKSFIKRELTLSGESFFEVTKDKQHPFTIYSGDIITKVWGTSFRIRAPKNSAMADVMVMTGKVSVKIAGKTANTLTASNKADGVMLLPTQTVIYSKAKHQLKTGIITGSSDMRIWQKTDLTFVKEPLKNVIKMLSQKFNVEIILEDGQLGNRLFNADFNDQNLPDIMEMLKKSFDLIYQADGDRFTFQKNNLKTQPIITKQ
jgi:transmembrane sensor